MQGANHYKVINDFSLSFLTSVEALKAFSDKYVFVKGKVVSLQAIVPSSLSFLFLEFDITITAQNFASRNVWIRLTVDAV